jgi:hypothetical protein
MGNSMGCARRDELDWHALNTTGKMSNFCNAGSDEIDSIRLVHTVQRIAFDGIRSVGGVL